MPTNITIRDIPDDIYDKLKLQSELHHRSINSEVIVHLKKILQSNHIDPAQIIARAKKIKQGANGSFTINQIRDAIDEGRP